MHPDSLLLWWPPQWWLRDFRPISGSRSSPFVTWCSATVAQGAKQTPEGVPNTTGLYLCFCYISLPVQWRSDRPCIGIVPSPRPPARFWPLSVELSSYSLPPLLLLAVTLTLHLHSVFLPFSSYFYPASRRQVSLQDTFLVSEKTGGLLLLVYCGLLPNKRKMTRWTSSTAPLDVIFILDNSVAYN